METCRFKKASVNNAIIHSGDGLSPVGHWDTTRNSADIFIMAPAIHIWQRNMKQQLKWLYADASEMSSAKYHPSSIKAEYYYTWRATKTQVKYTTIYETHRGNVCTMDIFIAILLSTYSICWFNFDPLAQGNAYKPTKEPINYRGPSGDRTHDLQIEATPPAASCPARTLHATEIA